MANKDSSQLIENLNFTDSELVPAYEAIIEAWSAALDLRDKEAKGHSRRVTEMTLSLAEAMGVSNQELTNFRWGALLHDIGNMAVPESILHKQGELTVEEWVTIHMHPYYAFEMLAPIDLLKPALDIPYCHHEKWDGTGYPRGLKGEQIPLAARIFAVADVWDALTSDRPYRKAWTKEKALKHIRTQAGKHFDPKIVNVFIKLVENAQEEH
jgi:HD-GYP domain-containing protein (c-di-GMP phosphodiesterase class II)